MTDTMTLAEWIQAAARRYEDGAAPPTPEDLAAGVQAGYMGAASHKLKAWIEGLDRVLDLKQLGLLTLVVQLSGQKVELSFTDADGRELDGKAVRSTVEGLEWVHATWADGRGLHPLAPMVEAWLDRPLEVTPRRWLKGIAPQFLAERLPRQGQLPSFDVRPAMPGPGLNSQAYFPALEPDAPPSPALMLALFDAGGGIGARPNGLVSIEARAFLEVLLGHPPEDRDGRLKETAYTIEEMAGDWLSWNLKHYRTSGKSTGAALRAALRRLRDIAVPMNDRGGFYYPVMVSAGQGWGLSDKIAFATRLPPSSVGPQINRAVLRLLRYAPAYRLYLNLCFEWDKYGARNGRLILPSRPEVRRAEGGQVVDAKGQILTGPGGRPVYTPHDKRAIQTGRREPNPARTRYPVYSRDDLAALAFPPSAWADKNNRHKLRERALKAACEIKALGGCVIDSERGLWRIMPRDFNADGPDIPALPEGKG